MRSMTFRMNPLKQLDTFFSGGRAFCNCKFMENNTDLSDLSFSNRYLAAHIMYLCLSIVIIIGNSLTILLIAKFPNLKTLTNAFIACLAVADLLIGTLLLFESLLYFTGFIFVNVEYHLCVYIVGLIFLSYASSINSLLGKFHHVHIYFWRNVQYLKHYTRHVIKLVVGH